MSAPARPSFAFAKRYGAALVELRDGRARIAHRPGVTLATLAELRRALGVPLELEELPPHGYDTLLNQLYGQGGVDEAQSVADDLDVAQDLKALADELPEPKDLLEADDDALVIRLINALLTQAIKENASDIHIEPFEHRLVVRFRVDGVCARCWPRSARSRIPWCRASRSWPSSTSRRSACRRTGASGSASRAARGRARVDHPRRPRRARGAAPARQAGRPAGPVEARHGGRDAPGARRADPPPARHHPGHRADRLGQDHDALRRALGADDQTRNILTVEDPIEYYIDGIGQTQVNTKVDMTFARGLRAILRQDPDVVMVGEIRDLETAEIAVQASLTGHLVLSTLHTNTASGAVTRLRDMGVEPFLLSSSLIGVLAQRLVRVLDPALREAYAATPRELAAFGRDPGERATLYRPGPEARGKNAGYKGRTGIYEWVPVDDVMRGIIHARGAEAELERTRGAVRPSITADGWAKCVAGITSADEVLPGDAQE
jgi:general secretion pathway protein E